MDGHYLEHSFQLENDEVVNYHVKPVPTIQFHTFVFYRKRNLSFEEDVPQEQFAAQTFFVCRLNQARPEYPVNVNRRTAMRITGRWTTTLILTEPGGTWCGAFTCWPETKKDYSHQFELAAGIAVRFGAKERKQ